MSLMDAVKMSSISDQSKHGDIERPVLKLKCIFVLQLWMISNWQQFCKI